MGDAYLVVLAVLAIAAVYVWVRVIARHVKAKRARAQYYGKIERLEPPGWPSTYHNPNDPPCTCGEDPHDKECPANDD